MGVPIIACNVGGISSLVDDGKDGFLVPSNDPYLLASRIVELSNNEPYLKIISKQAKEKAQKRHSKENISNQLINTYSFIAKINQ
jgi:glycosyltransferase involved in cell wall biosynthesis